MTRNNTPYQERKKKREELHASRIRDADHSDARYANDAKALDSLTSTAQKANEATVQAEAKITAGAGSGNLSADRQVSSLTFCFFCVKAKERQEIIHEYFTKANKRLNHFS